MTSAINDTFLTSINEAYPIAGVNNSSQGFRDNFARIKEGLGTAGKELTYLQDKRIEVIGDATGISGILGNSLAQPAPINLVLAASGATAGTYDTTLDNISLTVDAKGRITAVTATAKPTRPGVVGEYRPIATQSTVYAGNVREMTVPSLTFDEYGTLTVANNVNATLKFGLEGHTLPKGNLIVGHDVDGARAFPMPVQSFNPNDVWALAWRPVAGNAFGLQWYKLPAPTPLNPAQVISVVPGEGIHVSADPANPVVSFDFASFPEYPTQLAIQPGSKVLMWDGSTNTEYQIELAKIFTADPSTGDVPMFHVKDDVAPELGGDLLVGGKKIVGNRIVGMTLQTMDGGPLKLQNVQTVDPNGYNPNDPNNSIILPPDQWIYNTQVFPLKAPAFTAQDTIDGITTAVMRIDATGQMYWDKATTDTTGVQEVRPGIGISMSPLGPITESGSVNLDFSAEPLRVPDIYSDILVGMSSDREVYRNTIDQFTMTLPKAIAVDPVYGSDVNHPSLGQLNAPYRTITAALSSIPDGDPANHQIILFPGEYTEPLVAINKPNVQLVSLFGPEITIVRGSLDILPDMGNLVIKGISFDISTLTDPAILRVLTASSGIDGLNVENCRFYQDDTDYGRAREIILLSGTQNAEVVFNNCKFNGIFENNLIFFEADSFMDSRVRITNIIADFSNTLTVKTGAQTLTEISSASMIRQVIHGGGAIEVKNIQGMEGDWSDDQWNSIDPDTDDLAAMGVPRQSIVSTANANVNNRLSLVNVDLRCVYEQKLLFPTRINKTGTCLYIFSNVHRLPNIDTVNGSRDMYSGTVGADAVETVKAVTITGNYALRISESRTWDLTLNANATITLTEDNYGTNAFFPNTYANSLTIMVRQGTGGSNTIQFAAGTTIKWPDGAGQPATATGVGKVSLYSFIRIGNIWMGSRSFNEV